MAVFTHALVGGMGMVEKLAAAIGIVNVAVGIVVPFVESALVLDQFANHIVVGLGEEPLDLDHLLARRHHGLKGIAADFRQTRGKRAFFDVGCRRNRHETILSLLSGEIAFPLVTLSI